MRIFSTAIRFALLCLIPCAQAFETDDDFNRRIMGNEHFYKADASRDYKLTEADGKSWVLYGSLDADQDGVVTFEEFVAGAELLDPDWPANVKRNIVYKRVNGQPVLLDVYEPIVKKYEKAPVFYYTHGGGWSGGRKEFGGSERPLFEALSREGFVCVGAMYRMVKMWDPKDEVLMTDCLVDCRDGLRFLKKHEEELGLDMDRVVVFGSSAGGHIAQLLTFSDADSFAGDESLSEFKVQPAAGISWFGPSDFRDAELFLTDGLEDKFAPDHWARRITKGSEFNYTTADAAVQKMTDELSPVWWLNQNSAPLLHIHGDQDVVISPNHAHHLKKQAAAVGAPIEVMMVKGAAHGWWNEGIDPDTKTIEMRSIEFALKQAEEVK
jgi:acetyl esterase/lipase